MGADKLVQKLSHELLHQDTVLVFLLGKNKIVVLLVIPILYLWRILHRATVFFSEY